MFRPEDGPTIGPKRVAAIIIKYYLIKYKVVYYYYYILYYILDYWDIFVLCESTEL